VIGPPTRAATAALRAFGPLDANLGSVERVGDSTKVSLRQEAVRTIVTLLALYVLGLISLVAVSHEWRALAQPRSGVPFELLQSLVVVLLAVTLALLPLATRRSSKVLFSLCWGVVAADVVLRAIDWVVYFQSGLHMSLLVTNHAHGPGIRLALGFVPPSQLAIPVVVLAVVLLLARRSWRAVGRIRIPLGRLLTVGAVSLTLLSLGAVVATKPHVEHATAGPEWSLYRSLILSWRQSRCLSNPSCAETTSRLDETTRRKLTRFGIRVDPLERFPLIRPTVYRRDLPFSHSSQFVPKPNIVLVLLESMSSEFVGAYRPRNPSMTPNIDAFAAQSMRVENYFNATTPTVTAIVAELCSLYPPSGHEQFGRSFYGQLHCVADALAPSGYDSTFIRGVNKSFANVGPFLESEGFKVLDESDLKAALNEPGQSWGYSDHQLFRYLRMFLEARKADTPFFVGMTTVDLHPPFTFRRVPTILPGEEGKLLNIVHSTDEAFGGFWNWFKQSKFAANTILVVTGDHAIFPKPEYVALRGPTWEKSFYDRIPLIIHAPGLRLPAVWMVEMGSSVDLTPSLLHLLGINHSNPFEGNSLFDDRHGQTGVLSDHTYLLYSNQLDAKGKRVINNFMLHDCGVKGAERGTFLLTECEQIQWHDWKLRLIDQRRIWRR
jgi:hypothetical protein